MTSGSGGAEMPLFQPLEPRLLLSTTTISAPILFTTLDNGPMDSDLTVGSVRIADDLEIATGGMITANDPSSPPNASAAPPIILVVMGSMQMDPGSAILAENNLSGGSGGDITITVGGALALLGTSGSTPGAVISSSKTSGSGDTGHSGDITIHVTGNIDTQDGSLIAAGRDLTNKGPAGAIEITGHMINIDGQVLSWSGMTGTGANQPPGGGPITIKAGTGSLVISDTGVVSSKGIDPGADLVHLEGDDVTIYGLVESTGHGHSIPNSPANHLGPPNRPDKPANSTAGVEVWASHDLLIDAKDHNGQVNADTSQAGGTAGIAWIDLFAKNNITILAPLPADVPATGDFTVHADQFVTNAHGGLITVKAVEGSVFISGPGLQADAKAGGGTGGHVTVEAKGDIAFIDADLYARGDFAAMGGFGTGGIMNIRSYNGALVWINGIGDVRPTGDDVTPVGKQGTITLTYSTTIDTTGTIFPSNGTPTTPTIENLSGGAPTVPDYVVFQNCGNVRGGEDFGDAPTPYPTLLPNGARHTIVPGFQLGLAEDAETDGQPNVFALGDDLAGVPDDEDGVVFKSPLFPGGTVKVTVSASQPGLLDAWIDFNRDNDWDEATDQIFASTSLAAGDNNLTFVVPINASIGVPSVFTYARFRFSSAGGLSFTGPAPDGEVEDYRVVMSPYWTDKCAVISQLAQNMGGNPLPIPDVLVDVDSGPALFDPTKVGTLEPATNSIQAAVDYVNANGDVDGDGFLLVAVTAKDTFHTVTCQGVTFVGRYLGGNGTENVIISNASTKRLNVFGNSVNINAADVNKPVVTIENSLGKVTALDIHAFGSNVAGYLVQNNADLVVVKNTRAIGNNIGIWVKDNNVEVTGSPEVSGGKIGILVEGDNVTLRTNNLIVGNTQFGIKIVGNANESNGNDVGVSGRPNGVGISVNGTGNNLHDDDVTFNTGAAIVLAGNSNVVNGENIVSNGGAGIALAGSSGQITGNSIFSNGGDGINVAGAGNLIKGNTVGEKNKGNQGDGIHLVGNTNTVQENGIYSSTGDGIDLQGDGNLLKKNIVGDKSRGGNGLGNVAGNRDGIRIVGKTNTLDENTSNANKGYGFYISGATSTGNKLKNNKSNTDSSGGGSENGLAEYRFDVLIVNQGGNRKDNAAFTATAAGSYE